MGLSRLGREGEVRKREHTECHPKADICYNHDSGIHNSFSRFVSLVGSVLIRFTVHILSLTLGNRLYRMEEGEAVERIEF